MLKSKAPEQPRDKHGRFKPVGTFSFKRLILLGLALTLIPTAAVIMFSHGHQVITPTSPSKITISTSHLSHSSTGNRSSTASPGSTVTLVHGRAYSSSLVAQTIEFEGVTTLYVSVNFDANSVNYREYGAFLPTGSYGVQLWENTVPSDSRPECTAFNGSVSPFVVNGEADQVQNFTC